MIDGAIKNNLTPYLLVSQIEVTNYGFATWIEDLRNRHMKYLYAPASELPIPDDVLRLIDDAGDRIEDFIASHLDNPIPAFIPCEFTEVYRVLRSLTESMQGGCFVEWGAGFGVVATLAAKLGLNAYGIEIQPELVEAATELAVDHNA